MSQEMIQSVVYRPRLLLGLGQSVEIVQDFGAAGIEIEIKLAATAELEKVQTDPPPDEEPLVVDDKRHKACIGHVIEPPLELRPEVEDGCQEPRRGLQPALSPFLLLGMAADQGQTSWEISWSRRLSRRCSSIHERTSSVKSIGT